MKILPAKYIVKSLLDQLSGYFWITPRTSLPWQRKKNTVQLLFKSVLHFTLCSSNGSLWKKEPYLETFVSFPLHGGESLDRMFSSNQFFFACVYPFIKQILWIVYLFINVHACFTFWRPPGLYCHYIVFLFWY